MKKSKMSGIQKKYLKYMCTILILALVLSSICVWTYVRRNMTDVIVDKYEFMNEKMGIALDNLYRKTDAVTAEIILENDVQKSLRNKELQEVEKNALSKYFAYIDLNHVADYCYIDNKRNVYEKSYSQIGYSDFQSSGLREKMGDEYAKTQWIWTRDYLFGTGDEALFIGRYVNSMDYAHEPGIVYLKMNQQFLESVMDKDRKIAKDVAVGIISPEGKTCIRQEPEDLSIEKRTMKKITELTRTKKSGVIVRGKKDRRRDFTGIPAGRDRDGDLYTGAGYGIESGNDADIDRITHYLCGDRGAGVCIKSLCITDIYPADQTDQ